MLINFWVKYVFVPQLSVKIGISLSLKL